MQELIKKQEEMIATLQAQVNHYQIIFSYTEQAIDTLKRNTEIKK